MKIKLMKMKTMEENGRVGILTIPKGVLDALGWTGDDEVTLDIPTTGGGLRIFKDSDPIVLMGGVKEVINGKG